MIRNIKLVSGVQLIADISEEHTTEHDMVMYKPMAINVVMNKETDTPQLSLYPYLVEIDTNLEVVLRMENLEASAKPSYQLEQYYLQITSGIDLITKLKT